MNNKQKIDEQKIDNIKASIDKINTTIILVERQLYHYKNISGAFRWANWTAEQEREKQMYNTLLNERWKLQEELESTKVKLAKLLEQNLNTK